MTDGRAEPAAFVFPNRAILAGDELDPKVSDCFQRWNDLIRQLVFGRERDGRTRIRLPDSLRGGICHLSLRAKMMVIIPEAELTSFWPMFSN